MNELFEPDRIQANHLMRSGFRCRVIALLQQVTYPHAALQHDQWSKKVTAARLLQELYVDGPISSTDLSPWLNSRPEVWVDTANRILIRYNQEPAIVLKDVLPQS